MPNEDLYRVSRYLTVSRDRFRDADGRDVRLIYATRTASIMAVSDSVATRLASGDVAELPDRVVDGLLRAKALVTPREHELSEVVAGLNRRSDEGVRDFSLMPTSFCNMTCSYCGQEHQRGAQDGSVRDRVVARVCAALTNPGTRAVRVVWFGGEPMLALRGIQEMSAVFLRVAQETGTQYGAQIVTNGSLLTHRTLKVLYDECAIREIEVTLDGPAAVHDARRTTRSGRPSFARTVQALRLAMGDSFKELAVIVRMNIDRENEHAVPELIDHLAAQGLNHSRLRLSLMPVHSWGNDVSDVEMEPLRYAALETGWLAHARRLGIGFIELPRAVKQTTCIATNRHAELIDTAGKVYSCSEHPLVPRDRDRTLLATVSQLGLGQLRPSGMFDDWSDDLRGGAPCSRCPFLPVCGGSCPKLWREGAKPCPSFKYNVHERLALLAARLGMTRVSTEG
jgi:uncharacterized protein